MTCRQIRNEALAIYWSENTFCAIEPLFCLHHMATDSGLCCLLQRHFYQRLPMQRQPMQLQPMQLIPVQLQPMQLQAVQHQPMQQTRPTSPLLTWLQKIGSTKAQLITTLQLSYHFNDPTNPHNYRVLLKDCFVSVSQPAQWHIKNTEKAGLKLGAMELVARTHYLCQDSYGGCKNSSDCILIGDLKEFVKKLVEGKGKKRKTELEKLCGRSRWAYQVPRTIKILATVDSDR
ncbi:hypothetical protein CLAFUW4_08957 [Fulvia fulva]|nr:hypothetical protein CLAFUR4_08963 [Fulvia fulva]KAK4614712.1 hypothetical protein CLAFUR0_08955 [Fulvia fulva]WPV19824.1 hypothetical protein CLAFUW4_08957 [Fulvia fulva]WPV35195.1 hypothetical protein CLAFUW7_08958 [Fulvia fulva]